MKKNNKSSLGLGIKDGRIVKVLPVGKDKEPDFGDVDSILDLPKFFTGGDFDPPTEEDPKPTSLNQFELPPIDLPEFGYNPKSSGFPEPNFDVKFEHDYVNGDITQFFKQPQNTGEGAVTQNTQTKATTLEEHEAEAKRQAEEFDINAKSNEDFLNGIGAIEQKTVLNNVNTDNMKDYEKGDENKATQYENQYGGVDIETAIRMFGRGLGEKEGKAVTGMYGAKAALGLTRSFLGGLSGGKMNKHVNDKAEEKSNEKTYGIAQDGGFFLSKDDIIEIQNFKNGGEMELSKKLTGNFTEGLANENPEEAVVEAEDGEFILHGDGQVVEIKGNKHGKAGGEKLTGQQVQEGDKFVSNHLKLKADQAKAIKEEFGVKATTKDTYADVLRKVRKQVGLSSIIEEKEEIIKSIEEIQKKDESPTHKLNLDFLTGKLKNLSKKEESLQANFRGAVERVFDMQESTKPKKKEEAKMEEGGMFDESVIKELADKYGLPMEAALETVKAFSTGVGNPTDPDPAYVKRLAEETGLPEDEIRQKISEGLKSGALMYDQDGSVKDTANSVPFTLDEVLVEAPKKSGSATGAGSSDGEGGDDSASKEGDSSNEDKENTTGKVGDGSSDEEEGKNKKAFAHLPDQSVLPPNSMASHAKNTYSFGRLSGNKISAEEALAELGSQFNTAKDSLNKRGDAAYAGLLAQMLAGSEQQTNKVVTQTNMANQAEQNRVDGYNTQIADKEMMTNAAERLRFEQIQMKAKENTDMDMRDYVDYNRKVRLNNYNTVNQMNLLNELYDKFEFVDGEMREKGASPKFATPKQSRTT
jgi:hypothetical protein